MYKKNLWKKSYAFIGCMISVFAILFIFYLIKVHEINKEYYKRYQSSYKVALRKFPYPYHAAMAICNDIDNTETLDEFLEIHKFLNTDELTSMGKGVKLETGNSFFFYEPPGSAISYFSKESKVSETIIKFLKSGYIDCLHSYGKKDNFKREDAIKSLQELKKYNCKVKVWTDHTISNDNLGDDVTFGLGDHLGSAAYHADLTIAYGIKFAWLGRVTMIAGQAAPITIETFLKMYDLEHPIYSLVNICKELSKNFIANFGNKKYAMHKRNDLVKISNLDDGQKIYEFMRFDYNWKGVGRGADVKGLANSISIKVIDRLKKSNGYMIVYTHLGKNAGSVKFIPDETQNALRYLAKEQKRGEVYVTSTSKLLTYYVIQRYLNWSYKSGNNDEIIIQIDNVKDPIAGDFVPNLLNLRGITFYVPDKAKARIFLSGKEITNIQRNYSDYSGRESVTIPLT